MDYDEQNELRISFISLIYMMNSGQIATFLQRSRTAAHLLQLLPLLLKTAALRRDSRLASRFVHRACSISLPLAASALDRLPRAPSRFAWNSIIRSYAKSSTPLRAVELFARMRTTGVGPDKFTYPFVVKACGKCGRIGEGRGVHALALKVGLGSDSYVGNTLVRMYAACGEIGLARQVFDEMRTWDIASWSSMIAGYAACGFPEDAFKIFGRMRLANEKPISVTLVSLLSASSHLVNLRAGSQSIHASSEILCIWMRPLEQLFLRCIPSAVTLRKLSRSSGQWMIRICSVGQ
ncbi:pentatricopeptide repeat-containing protein At2g34400 [Eucalyptus grandis]|uniref:pentatricopeptide repeat-containing protein At2g34400 n=1 Tax=Eucalyptus grandis TaxID=71139 RepID=UPI00192EEA2F|nr:pentatricopeptide repeat-containing protein At2g34400 [Eucalyptus grandis]XP_039159963.1 pentatricopeptide repeat-containing protein At2g34400 [Eucalyptus grandis]